jgi:predicted dehydrogenase
MRIGIVGLGWAARAFHVPALRELASVQLIGGADSDPAQRASWERDTRLASFSSFDELLERGRPDAVVIATPPQSHAGLCISALQAGLHVICEKPFVASLAEADQVLAAAASAGKQVAVNHEFREMPIYRALHEQIGRPGVGRLVFCQIWQLMDLAPWDEPVP